jgi:hypothetical protein
VVVQRNDHTGLLQAHLQGLERSGDVGQAILQQLKIILGS